MFGFARKPGDLTHGLNWKTNLRGEAIAPLSISVKAARFSADQWTYEVFDYRSWLHYAAMTRSGWSL